MKTWVQIVVGVLAAFLIGGCLCIISACFAGCTPAVQTAIKQDEIRFDAALNKECKLEETQPADPTLTAVVCGAAWTLEVFIPTSEWQRCPVVQPGDAAVE